MSSSQNNIIALGVTLLKEGVCQVPVEYKNVFELLRVDISTPLQLKALKSVFFKSSDTSVRYYPSSVLSSEKINYPIDDVPASVKFDKIDGKSLTHLEKYGSFVAVDGCDQIPVYDLFKTAAALYDCLEKGQKEEPFLLVTADFSGIQDTVYTISSKGALKTLRARSFMLELLTEHIIYELLQASRSDKHAIIYSGGGGFSLLLPNTEDNVNAINDYRDILNRWAFTEFSGKLFIALDALECNKDKLKCKEAFKELRQTQADNLDKLKRRKFIKQLDELFTPTMPEQLNVQTECQITRRDDLPPVKMFALPNDLVTSYEKISMQDVLDNKKNHKSLEDYTWASESCFHQYHLGDKLIGAKTIYRSKKTQKNQRYFTFKDRSNNDVYYSVENNGNIESTWQINSWDKDSPTILYADYVRTIEQLPKAVQDIEEKAAQEENRSFDKKNTATFEGLAASSCGANLIGGLRMDVDNMGNLFSEIGSLTELSTKSRMLNIFFKVYLNKICAGNLDGKLIATDIVGKEYDKDNEHRKAGRNVSVIYAGGDDLFILGAWDETTELAFDIQRCFALFTDGLGISGGLTLHQPKFPLYQMAKKSGEAEHVAKNARRALKNCFTPFLLGLTNNDKSYEFNNNKTVRVIDWNDITFFDILKNLVALTEKQCVGNQIDAIKLEGVSRGFIYKLFEASDVWVTKGALYLPRLRYIFARLEKEYKTQKNSNIQALYNLLFLPDKRENSIKRISLTLNWFEQLQRSK